MKVTGENLSMTRGDSESLTVTFDNLVLSEGDEIHMTVRKTAQSDTVEIHKVITEFPNNEALIVLKPEDTSSLSFGSHVYDIQLTTKDGIVITIIKPHSFYLDKEVTYG